ncbi:MAG: dihydroorotase [Candidatus Marinimicrobia bacterium]|nr:dihydroorotase [Candidatus Neomarinimicrobiota bacterium]
MLSKRTLNSKGNILLKNGRIYDPFLLINEKSDLLISDGFIEEIKKDIKIKKDFDVIDCEGKIITNGFVDIHAHFREPGFEFKETLETGSTAAIHGGYTRVCTMPNTNPVIDTPELVKFIIDSSIDLPIYIHPIGAITKGQKGLELAEIGQMIQAGAVAISDDGLPLTNSQLMRYALEYSKKFGIPVINHAEDCCLVNQGTMHEGDVSLNLGLVGNPDISESTMIYRDLAIADYVGGSLHIPHVSSSKSLDVIKFFKEKGVNVSVEVTPHHLALTDKALQSYDTNAKVAPPIRSDIDRESIQNAVCSGLINCIATDHAPHSIVDKERDFNNASCGMIGLESAFGVTNKVLKDKKTVESIIDLFTINPCKIINIEPNLIMEKKLAELNIIDPNIKWEFKPSSIKSKSSNSPFVGEKLIGKVMMTINKGFCINNF